MFEKMLVAVDASERRESTVKAAADLAKISGGEVEVLHVREGHFIGRAGAVPDEGGEEAQEIVDESVATLKNAGVQRNRKAHGRSSRARRSGDLGRSGGVGGVDDRHGLARHESDRSGAHREHYVQGPPSGELARARRQMI